LIALKALVFPYMTFDKTCTTAPEYLDVYILFNLQVYPFILLIIGILATIFIQQHLQGSSIAN